MFLDDVTSSPAVRGGGSKQSRWPSLLSLFSASASASKPGQVHRAPPSRTLATSRQFQSEINVLTAADRKLYGGPVTSPEVDVRRPSSALSPRAFVAVDIPLLEDVPQTDSSTNRVRTGKNRL